MASQAVVAAVEARLKANWTQCTVVDRNRQEQPPADGTPYLIVQFPVAQETQISIGAPGNNVFREEGAIRLVLHARRGRGIAEALAWIEQLRDLFRGRQFAGVNTWAPAAAVEDDVNESGTYYRFAFAVPYYFDRIA